MGKVPGVSLGPAGAKACRSISEAEECSTELSRRYSSAWPDCSIWTRLSVGLVQKSASA